MVLSRRELSILFGVLAIEVALSLGGSVDEVGAFVDGRRDAGEWVGLLSVAWLPLVLLAAGRVGISLLRARRALYSREQALAAVADTSTDWLWEADTQHRITYSSPGVTPLLGYRPDELLGRSTLSMLPAGHHAFVDHLLHRSVGDGNGWDAIELPWLAADGTLVRLMGNAAPIKDARGEVVGFRGTRRAVRPAELAERALAGAGARLRELLDGATLTIALQPIVDVNTGVLAGVEALARFPDGRGPDLWFRDAADVGLALELDRLAFRAALALFPQLPAGVYLSVNATPELVLSGVLQSDLLQRDVNLPLDRLVIEITEHARVTSYADLQASLTPLRERGVRVAVDDTGAGYASLSHVLQLRPSIIKLDRSLIADLGDDRARRSLVTALVLLALDLGASITGEGIETADELDTLRLLGVDTGQGYLLARPSSDRQQWHSWWARNWLPAGSTATAPAAGTVRWSGH